MQVARLARAGPLIASRLCVAGTRGGSFPTAASMLALTRNLLRSGVAGLRDRCADGKPAGLATPHALQVICTIRVSCGGAGGRWRISFFLCPQLDQEKADRSTDVDGVASGARKEVAFRRTLTMLRRTTRWTLTLCRGAGVRARGAARQR